MACFLSNRQNTSITIPKIETNENYTVYVITVKVGNIIWTVQHRYSDFVELHEKLVSDHGVDKDILPPKKVIGNKEPSFIEKRRSALETYISSVLKFLQQAMPRELAQFLDFQHYDILYILQNMALQFYTEGDELLQISKSFTFSLLQLHSISERLKQPCPPLEILNKKLDFSHVMDFCCQLTTVIIVGSTVPVRTSNIIPNNLFFELSVFKAVRKLNLIGFPVSNIYSVGTLRDTVTSLNVHEVPLKKIADILLCDVLHKEVLNPAAQFLCWRKVIEADFSNNRLEEIDEAIKLMPNLEHLMLNNNSIGTVRNLTSLPRLSRLSLSANKFTEIDDLYTKVGHIIYLDISQNSITSLKGFSKLYSLESLDLGWNQISDVKEIVHISGLPCLENLILTGNPLSTIVDYRVRVLERFESRASEICLDNEKSTQKELDTVAVLQAIRIVKEGRTPTMTPELSFPNGR